jgi:hypothetical protein
MDGKKYKRAYIVALYERQKHYSTVLKGVSIEDNVDEFYNVLKLNNTRRR